MRPTIAVFFPADKVFASRAALAAVRFALIIEPSRNASGLPVRVELSITTAEARSRPTLMLSGKEETYFTPATLKSPPRYAGKAIILFPSLFGNRKNVE
jgi:hypothetical protein